MLEDTHNIGYSLNRAQDVQRPHRGGGAVYDFKRCSIPGCEATAIHTTDFCADHHPNPDAIAATILESLSTLKVIKSMNLAGLRFEGAVLSGRQFFACSLSKTLLRNINFSACSFRMCFFDFCSADSCDFSGIDAQFCSFAGSRFLNVSFEHSELVQNNFDGTCLNDCTFNYSNLYNSRFIMAEFEKTDFIDCNLKRTLIIPSKETEVSWRLSNTQEAIFELDGIDQ